ncbi:SusD/RagB family nutrient-binding outer membrane lipoprotein [Hymenobacter sp. ASUV-10]|uniref:SusD/RagB family nutrient-binding outer membrane lipoprotein n=1 Tax=Hymenobacter aranciens TaxID=3063996 RepID=A0ABT9BED7_9BACT|nr:SusD/RagB family nutrient-binding outer membrane lipoprotein [Hymenobacter sp. ASUV-10]MDO7876634.1 SusD/RagB family nutrient-binding outer membrane lipoprotein [Hymenobacter sp. ASUV-10]
MKFRHIPPYLAALGLLMAAPGCKDFYDVNVDPIHPTAAEPQQLLPVVQLAMSTHLGFNIQGLGQPAAALVQQLSNGRGTGAYQQESDSFQSSWNGLYSDMLANNEQLITQATAAEQWGYVGIAKIQKAYVFSQLVDAFGSVPYSQALKGVANRAPRFDRDADIYNGEASLGIQSLFSLIDEGIADLDRPNASVPSSTGGDIIYKGNKQNWQALGRSLKLKLYNQIRKTTDVSASVRTLLGQQLLTSNSDFELKYGTSTQPENRHIGFLSDYVNSGRENQIGRYFYLLMKYGNGFEYAAPVATPYADPRIPYYFYRQSNPSYSTSLYDYQDRNNPSFVTTRLGSRGPAASAGNAGDRTLPGLYPYAGRYDDGKFGLATGTSASGAGTQRFITYFTQKFTEAELQLMVLNNESAAQTAYLEGVKAAFAKVNALATGTGAPSFTQNDSVSAELFGGSYTRTRNGTTTTTTRTGYYNDLFTTRNGQATTQEQKLQAIMEQKYIASFGMTLDVYTDFRRTHYPLLPVPETSQANTALGLFDDQDGQTVGTGQPFPRRLFYPLDDLISNTNPDAPKAQVPYSLTDNNYRIFWDR